MKKIVLVFLTAITIFSCKETPKDYVTLQGKITNPKDSVLTIMGKSFMRPIQVTENGTFKDTLKVTNGFHGFKNGVMQSFIYLKNGDEIILNFDSEDFPGSIEFSGEGAGTNIYLSEKMEYIQKENLNNVKETFALSKEDFDAKMERIKNEVAEMLENAKDLDTTVYNMEVDQNAKMIEYFTANYEREHKSLEAFKPGTPSPKFNYPDVNGKNVSLDDFKGKYVYIDIWATWCAPCKREIPFLKELNKEYKGKDLAIVSLSIDKMENKDKWLQMVKDKNLEGTQIMADKDWNSEFTMAYGIKSIPRFILLDKEGNIVNSDAPRPSDPRLKETLNGLDL
ncbi:MAG: redoxin family protein [Bacteroidota bacterium]